MQATLVVHPDTPCDAVERIVVQVSRTQAGALMAIFIVTGKISAIRWPKMAGPSRADDLWKHTCFEAFVREGAAKGYAEFNFSPSLQWAAYRFDDYRAGMANADVESISIEVESQAARYQMLASTPLAAPARAPLSLALSAVIEETNGRKSYWALRHPPGKPDFHHSDCFALELSPPSRA